MAQHSLSSSSSSAQLPHADVLRAGTRQYEDRFSAEPRNPREMSGAGPHTQSAAALPSVRSRGSYRQSRSKPTIPVEKPSRATSKPSLNRPAGNKPDDGPLIQGLPHSGSLAQVMLSVERMGAGIKRSSSVAGSRQSLHRPKLDPEPVSPFPKTNPSKALHDVAKSEQHRFAMWRQNASPAHLRRGQHLHSGIDTVLQGVVDKVDPTGESVRLFLNSWLERYVQEEELFDSKMVFCEMKLQELRHLTDHLPRPNPFRTWVCADLLMKLIDSFTDPRTRVVVSKVVEVVLSSVYTDEESSVGLVPYALRARALYTELQDMRRMKAESLAKFTEVQSRWHNVLAKWHPAIERAIVYWTRPLKTVVFLYWRRWAQLKRKRMGAGVMAKALTWGGRVQPGGGVLHLPTATHKGTADTADDNSTGDLADEDVQAEDAVPTDSEDPAQEKGLEATDSSEVKDTTLSISLAAEQPSVRLAFEDRLLLMRKRYDVRTVASRYFYEWKDVTLRSRTNKMKAERQAMVDHNARLQAEAEKVRVLKYALKDQLDRSQEQLEVEQERCAGLHKRVTRLQRAEGDVAQERTYAERITKAFVWLYRVTTAGMIDGTRRLMSRGLQDPSLIKGFDDSLRELSKDESTKQRDAAERRRLNLQKPSKPLQVWLKFQLDHSGVLDADTRESQGVSSETRFMHAADSLGSMPDPFDAEGGLLSSLVRRNFSPNLLNPDSLVYQSHIDSMVHRMTQQALQESKQSVVMGLEREAKLKERQYGRSSSLAHSLVLDSDADDTDDETADNPSVKETGHPSAREGDAASQHNTVADEMAENAPTLSESLHALHQLRSQVSDHQSKQRAKEDNTNSVSELMSILAAQQAKQNREADAAHWPDCSARTADDFRLSVRQRDRHIDPFVLDAVQLLEQEVASTLKEAQSSPTREQSSPTTEAMDPDMKDAVTLWLAIAYPGLPGDYDDLLLLKEELKHLESEYCDVLSGERQISSTDELQQMLQSVVAMRNALTATRKQAYEADTRWRTAVDEAERDVFHRLLGRINLTQQQPFSALDQRTTQRFTRSQHIIRSLIMKLDSVELQIYNDSAENQGFDLSRIVDPVEVLRVRKASRKIKQSELDREILECELALGKHYTSLRRLFHDHATAPTASDIDDDHGGEEEVSALKFWLLVREHDLCNNRCKAPAVEKLFIQRVKARNELAREQTDASGTQRDSSAKNRLSSLTFDDFIELLLRIAALRMGKVPFPRRLSALLEEALFPTPHLVEPTQAQPQTPSLSGKRRSISVNPDKALGVPSVGVRRRSVSPNPDGMLEIPGGSSRRRSLSPNPDGSNVANGVEEEKVTERRKLHFRQELKGSAFERMLEREETYLRSLFSAYSRHVASSKRGIVMSSKDFKQLVDDAQLIADGHISERAVFTTFEAVQLIDHKIPEVFAAADERAALEASSQVYTGPGSGFSQTNKHASGSAGEIVFIDFVEALTSLACYCYKNPYLPLERRLRLFIVNVLQASATVETKRKHYVARHRPKTSDKDRALAEEKGAGREAVDSKEDVTNTGDETARSEAASYAEHAEEDENRSVYSSPPETPRTARSVRSVRSEVSEAADGETMESPQ